MITSEELDTLRKATKTLNSEVLNEMVALIIQHVYYEHNPCILAEDLRDLLARKVDLKK